MTRGELTSWYNALLAVLGISLIGLAVHAPGRLGDAWLVLGVGLTGYFLFLFLRLAFLAGKAKR